METWAFDARIGGGEPQALILRRDMGRNMYEGALSRAEEFAVLQAAHAAGVLAPEPLFLHDPQGDAASEEDRPFFVMRRLPGVSVGPRVVRDPRLASGRKQLAEQMAEQMARIHQLDPAALPFLPRPAAERDAIGEVLAILARTAAQLDEANPVWAWGLRWLERHRPDPAPLRVLHGDFRIGNLLVTSEGLSGVLDWEFAHLGDPAEDLAWPLVRDWRFGNDALHVGGVGQLEPYLAAYEAAGGTPVAHERLFWWEVAGNLRWAIFARSQAERHLSGADPSVELASLGRKSAEMEWELLRLLNEARKSTNSR